MLVTESPKPRSHHSNIQYIAQFAYPVGLNMCFEPLALSTGQPMQGLLRLGLLALTIGEKSTLVESTALLAGQNAGLPLLGSNPVGLFDPAENLCRA